MREYDRQKNEERKRLFHWSLDMPPAPDDDVNVSVNKGITWKEIAAVGSIALASFYIYTQNDEQKTTPPPAAVSPGDSEYEVRFYDRDGKPINFPQRVQ